MKEEIRRLIRQGLYQDNLLKLIPLCKALFNEAPSLYGTLIYMFESFAEEYDNQGISVSRYDLILGQIQVPLLLLLEDEKDSAVFVHRLNDVFRAFAALRGFIE